MVSYIDNLLIGQLNSSPASQFFLNFSILSGYRVNPIETNLNGQAKDIKNISLVEQHHQKLLEKDEPYYVGFIMRHVDSANSGKFKKQFVIFIRSIFKNLNRLDRDIHFIILTDLKSSHHVTKILDKFLRKDVHDRLKVTDYKIK